MPVTLPSGDDHTTIDIASSRTSTSSSMFGDINEMLLRFELDGSYIFAIGSPAAAHSLTVGLFVDTVRSMTQSPHGRIELTSEIPGYYRAMISNPPINLADPEFFYDLRSVIDVLDADDEARVVVFESATADFFLAHLDLSQNIDHSPGPTGLPLIPDLTTRLAQAPYVSIASIRGRARGVGSEFVLACDMRFASRELAVLSQPEVGCGLFPGGGGTERLPALVGRARALEIVLGCEDVDAETAERYGYVNRAIPDDELDAFVDRLARRIASFDCPALTKGKAHVNHSSPLPAGADLVAAQDAFYAALPWAGAQRRIARLFELGFQQPGDVEQRLGDVLGELSLEPTTTT